MDHIPQLSDQRAVTSSPVSTSTGEVTLGTWVTPVGSPGVPQIGPGLFRFRTYAYASSASGKTWLKFYIINRSASGNETVLFFGNAVTRDIDATTVPTEYLTSYARRNYTTMFSGDRLAIRVNASTDSASARTVTMEVAGNTNASMVGVSYFLCDEITNSTTTSDIDDAILMNDATAAAFGIVGGLVTSVLILRKRKEKTL